MQTVAVPTLSLTQRLAAFAHLCKPRVNSLIVFTAMIGMFLATPGFPPVLRFLVASLGIALVAFAAAALNCLVERTIDARMARPAGAPRRAATSRRSRRSRWPPCSAPPAFGCSTPSSTI